MSPDRIALAIGLIAAIYARKSNDQNLLTPRSPPPARSSTDSLRRAQGFDRRSGARLTRTTHLRRRAFDAPGVSGVDRCAEAAPPFQVLIVMPIRRPIWSQPASGARNATPSVLHQRHIGRVRRPSCRGRGRRLHRHAVEDLGQADALLFAGDLRNDGGSVAAAGADGREARVDGTFARSIDAAGVSCVEHPGSVRLERGARARGSGRGRSDERESGKGLLVEA